MLNCLDGLQLLKSDVGLSTEYSVRAGGQARSGMILMIAFLSLLLHVVVSPFRTKARLEAEIILLRHQLNVLRRRVPSEPEIGGRRPISLCLAYRLFPAVFECRRCPTGNRYSMASDGFRLYWRWCRLEAVGQKIPGNPALIRETAWPTGFGAPRSMVNC